MRALFLALISLGMAASAESAVYKCVVDGKTTYGDQPCAAKTGGPVEIIPNAVSPIDQSANAAKSKAISDAAAARVKADVAAREKRRKALEHTEAAQAKANTNTDAEGAAPADGYYYPGSAPYDRPKPKPVPLPTPVPDRTVPANPRIPGQ